MIVEDDTSLGDALSKGLKHDGHVVDWFCNAPSADQAIKNGQYDAVILDIGLPQEDGISLLKKWRLASIHLPVLILTARDGLDDRITGLDAGADDYLVKPVSLDEISARLRAMLRRTLRYYQHAPLWQHGPLQYDPNKKIAFWKEKALDLRKKELLLIEIFLMNPEKILSKNTLKDKLYDVLSDEPDSNSLEVHIYHIRKKTHPQLIRNIRGIGYILGSPKVFE